MPWCSLCCYSFITNRVGRTVYFNGEMRRIKAVFLVWSEFYELVLFLAETLHLFKSYRGKRINRFEKVQLTRAGNFVAEAINLVITIRLIVLSCGHLNNDRISQGTTISIDDLKINISWVTLGYFTGVTKMAVKYGRIGSNRKLFSENIFQNSTINFFIKLLIPYLQLIHHSILASPRNSIMMLQITNLLCQLFEQLIIVFISVCIRLIAIHIYK